MTNRLAIDIQRGRSSKPDLVPMPSNGHDGCKLHSKQPERITYNVAMRLRDSESKFSGDTNECWDEYVNTYKQMAKDYRLSDEQKLQFLHNTLNKDALRFYKVMVAPNMPTHQQAVNQISMEYILRSVKHGSRTTCIACVLNL